MKKLIVALLAVFTLMTSLLSPAPALALSSPISSLIPTHAPAMVFMAKTADAKAKEAKGQAPNAAAAGAKGAKVAGPPSAESNLKFGNKIADKAS